MFVRRSPNSQDVALSKMALDRAVGADHVRSTLLDFDEVAKGQWIKVAYSPTLRRTGELLNFFPGKYPGGYPNAPSPLAATLTGGLVGAGLGYGGGYLAEKMLPRNWRRGDLRRTLALLGGVVGAAPGAAWSYSAASRGRSLLDGSDLADPPGSAPRLTDIDDLNEANYGDAAKEAADHYDVELCSRYKQACDGFVKRAYLDTIGNPYARSRPAPTAIDVNINTMGHTLWEVGASPQTAATTMGALYAAQQMPDQYSQPGHVTPHQTGLLGTMMGAAGGGAKGYATGWLAGKALGLLTGMPAGTQNTFKNTGALIGVVNAVVPRMFGY